MFLKTSSQFQLKTITVIRASTLKGFVLFSEILTGLPEVYANIDDSLCNTFPTSYFKGSLAPFFVSNKEMSPLKVKCINNSVFRNNYAPALSSFS